MALTTGHNKKNRNLNQQNRQKIKPKSITKQYNMMKREYPRYVLFKNRNHTKI